MSTHAALMLLEPAEVAKVEMFQGELSSIVADWTAGPLASVAEDGRLADLMIRGAAAEKELDRTRLAATAPLRKQVDAINALFATVTDQFRSLRERGDKQRREYRAMERARIDREQAEQRRRQIEAAQAEEAALIAATEATTLEARAKALADADAASRDQAVAVLAEPEAVTRGTRTDSGSASWRKVWRVEVVDEAQVPRQYLAVDMPKLRAAVKGGLREIAGCSITEEEESTLRPGR